MARTVGVVALAAKFRISAMDQTVTPMSIFPQMRPSFLQREPLSELAKYLWEPGDTIAEIGCFAGESTLIFLQAGLRVHAIDPWTEESKQTLYAGSQSQDGNQCKFLMRTVEQHFDERCGGWDTLNKIKLYDHECLYKFPDGSLDGIYIDSVHTYDEVAATIKRWHPKVKPNRWIAGHDYTPDFPGVIRAINDTIGHPTQLFGDTSWAIKRPRKLRK